MELEQLLTDVQHGSVSVEEAMQQLRRQPFEEMGYAKLDTHRKLRSGFPEVVFCSGNEGKQGAVQYAKRQFPGYLLRPCFPDIEA